MKINPEDIWKLEGTNVEMAQKLAQRCFRYDLAGHCWNADGFAVIRHMGSVVARFDIHITDGEREITDIIEGIRLADDPAISIDAYIQPVTGVDYEDGSPVRYTYPRESDGQKIVRRAILTGRPVASAKAPHTFQVEHPTRQRMDEAARAVEGFMRYIQGSDEEAAELVEMGSQLISHLQGIEAEYVLTEFHPGDLDPYTRAHIEAAKAFYGAAQEIVDELREGMPDSLVGMLQVFAPRMGFYEYARANLSPESFSHVEAYARKPDMSPEGLKETILSYLRRENII